MGIKYFKVNNKTLATALNYCGFRFFKNGDFKNPIYTFEDTVQFREALGCLNDIRRKNNNYIK